VKRKICFGALGIAVVLLAGLAFGALQTQVRLNSSGVIVAYLEPKIRLGVYSDQGCTAGLQHVDWGTPGNGSFTSVHMWIRNEGNVNCTVDFYCDNFTPANFSSYLTIGFVFKIGMVLMPLQILPATVTLYVLPDALMGSFSFDIVVLGEG